MTLYTKFVGKVVVSENSDYSEPIAEAVVDHTVVTNTDVLHFRKLSCAVAGSLVWDASEYNWDPTLVLIENLDATNFVTVTTTTTGDVATIKLLPGECCVLAGINATGDITITADTAVCDCEVFIVGA